MSIKDRIKSLEKRGLTRLRVLECIRESTEISRIDIAARIKISPATVTSVTVDLLSAGLIKEVQSDLDLKADSGKRGRPRVMLRLNGEALKVAGLKIARHAISVLISDFEGEELIRYEYPLPKVTMTPSELANSIYVAVDTAAIDAGFSINDISGIAVGIAGQVNPAKNFIHWSSSVSQRNVNLTEALENRIPCPVFLENDTNLVAKAEHRFGEGKGLKTFLVVTIEHGVGLGIILDGQLFSGHRGCGAEFGHMKVHLNGALCQCGQRGCLEAYVSDYALMREMSVSAGAVDITCVADIFKVAKDGDRLAESVLDRAGKMFGMGMGNLINLFDPERIILSGGLISFDHLHSDHVMDIIKRSVVNDTTPLPEIIVHRWGDAMWAKGAAAYGIEQVSMLRVKDEIINAK